MTARALELEETLQSDTNGRKMREELMKVEAEKKALIDLQSSLTAEAQKNSLDMANRVGKEVAQLREAKESFKQKERKNRMRRDDQVERLREEYKEKVAQFEREFNSRREETGSKMSIEMLAKSAAASSCDPYTREQMRTTLKGQQNLVEMARMEACELVETFSASLAGMPDAEDKDDALGSSDVGDLVGELSGELKKQNEIVGRIRKTRVSNMF